MSNVGIFKNKHYQLVSGEIPSSCHGCAFIDTDCIYARDDLGDCGLKIYKEVNETVEDDSALDETVMVNIPTLPDGVRVSNALGGTKNDGGKVRPTLLVKSMPNAVKQLLQVLENGAAKYGKENWKLVETERYDDALMRHLLDYFAGNKIDNDSGLQHLAHVACNVMFLLEMELAKKE